MTFLATDPSNHKGKTDSWLTPLWLINSLGNFDLDPCGFKDHKTAAEIYELPQNGLELPWYGTVWLNPPYSEVGKWLERLSIHGQGTALVFNRSDTKIMQEQFKKCSSVFFLEGRLSFLKRDFTTLHNAGTGSMLLSYGWTPNYTSLKGWKAK